MTFIHHILPINAVAMCSINTFYKVQNGNNKIAHVKAKNKYAFKNVQSLPPNTTFNSNKFSAEAMQAHLSLSETI